MTMTMMTGYPFKMDSELTNCTNASDDIALYTDDELKALIDKAQSILEEREKARRKQALAEIRKIAKAHGLDVAVTAPKRAKGRPR